MSLPASSPFQFTADLGICRILNGMWQVSGAHGAIDPARAVEEMFAYHDAGFTTWDLADHYGPAEDFIGAFRRQFATRYGAKRLSEIQAFTKWVPYPGRMTRQVVEQAVGAGNAAVAKCGKRLAGDPRSGAAETARTRARVDSHTAEPIVRRLAAGGRWIRTFGPPPPGARRQIPGLQAKTPSRRPCAQLGKSESGYQAPAAVRWVTVSRGGARKVW